MAPASDDGDQPEEATIIDSNSNANVVDQSSLSTPAALTPEVPGTLGPGDSSDSYSLTTIFIVVAFVCFAAQYIRNTYFAPEVHTKEGVDHKLLGSGFGGDNPNTHNN